MSLILRKISDFEYYFGGQLFIRKGAFSSTEKIVDLDNEFLLDRNNFHIIEFNELEILGYPIIKVHMHNEYETFHRVYGTIDFELEDVKKEDKIPKYSENNYVNILMAIMRDLIPHKFNWKIPYDINTGNLEVYSGKYSSSRENDGYHILLYEYGFRHKVWCKINGVSLRNIKLNTLTILNWNSTPIENYINKYNGDLTDEEIKSIPYNIFSK